MQRARAAICISALAVMLTACSDGGVMIPDGEFASEAAEARTPVVAAGLFSQAVARSMSDTEIQAVVRDVLRASRLGEHKVVLQDFLQTPAGSQVLNAAAEAVDASPATLRDLVALLPEMDFYVPIRDHRLNWHVGDPLVVAAALDVDSTVVTAYDTHGRARIYRNEQGDLEAATLFLMHPAETTGRRLYPQSDTKGDVIQDSGDGELWGVWTEDAPDGTARRVELADVVAPYAQPARSAEPARKLTLWPALAEGIGGIEGIDGTTRPQATPSATGGTFLTQIIPNFYDGFGQCEMYSYMSFYEGTNRLESRRWPSGSYGGLPCHVWTCQNCLPPAYWDFSIDYPPYGPHLIKNHYIVWADEHVKFHLFEDDAGGDDDYGKFDLYSGDVNWDQNYDPLQYPYCSAKYCLWVYSKWDAPGHY